MTLIQGDCVEVMRSMPEDSVDAVVTDPPYGTGQWVRPQGGAGRDCTATQQREPWDRWDLKWLAEARRVVRGSIGLFVPPRELPSLFTWIVSEGTPWRMFVWCKSDPRPRFGGQPAYGFDPFVVIGPVQRIGGKDWEVHSSPRVNRDREAVGHPHQKRLDLMRWLVKLVTPPGGVVLDPFAGSASTLVAAIQEGFEAVGIEREQEYLEIAERRVAHARAEIESQPLMLEV